MATHSFQRSWLPARPSPLEVALGPDETLDAVCRGEVLLVQSRKGYRFSIDPILLAAWAGAPQGPAVDLGTGCGVIPLLMARRGAQSVVAVELQPSLYQLAVRNVLLNRCEQRIRVVQADLRCLRGVLQAEGFDLVVSNPPYVARGAGNVNPESEKAIARHEVASTLPELARAARYLLREGGALKLVFPASRLVELLTVLSRTGLEPRRMRLVHPLASRPARMVLVEAIKGGGEVLEVLPPLVLHTESGYTAEALQLLQGAAPAVPAPGSPDAAREAGAARPVASPGDGGAARARAGRASGHSE